MGREIPTGTVSFLFTDIEGSTRLWEADADRMGLSLQVHDQIMREAVASSRGHVFSTSGDAFAVAFASVGDAVAAAIQGQLDLLNVDWPGPSLTVRMGIHTGIAEERNGDYYGPVLNRGARIMSAGHGGQILVSSATVESVNHDHDVSLKDLGIHRLRDIEEPEHLFEIRHSDLPVIEKQIRTPDARRSNLPDYLNTFVGRTAEVDELMALINENRLVALTGVGGTGKTRLAVEVARSTEAELPDGAWIAQLAPLTDPAFIMTTIGDIWGLHAGEGATIKEVVTRFLWSRELLLIIDNCEHLLDAASTTIKYLLDACPKLRIVATSRESLGLPGEALLRVPSLALPDASASSSAVSEAVLLFLDRAGAARSDFEPTDQESVDIERICTRIDGIPLGLELAAARLRSMSTTDLADKLEGSFRILSGSAKAALPRQRTLQATIGWSYNLLKSEEQAMFRRLSVFSGGFSLEAAEAVCIGGEVEPFSVLDIVDSLVDKSLVITDHYVAGGTRYRLLEPVRQYAQERLSDAGEPERFRREHADYFVTLAALASPGLCGLDQVTWGQRIDDDYDNFRMSFATLLETDTLNQYLDMAFDLYLYWTHRGMQTEGIDIGLAGLAVAPQGTDPNRMAKVWFTTAWLEAELTRPEGIDHARAGLAVAEATGDPNLVGRMEVALGTCVRQTATSDEYLEHLLEGRRLLEAHPEPHWWEPTWERGFHDLLFGSYFPPNDDRSKEHLLAALEIFEQSGDRMLLAATLAATVKFHGGGDREVDEWVLTNLARACDILSGLDSPNRYGRALHYRGMLLYRKGAYRDARDSFQIAMRHLEEVGDVSLWGAASRGLVRSNAALGDAVAAQATLAAVVERMPIQPMQEVVKPRTLDAAADVFVAAERYEEAAITLGAALAAELPGDYGRHRDPMLAAVRKQLVSAIGESDTQRLIAEGGSLGLGVAIERVRVWLQDG